MLNEWGTISAFTSRPPVDVPAIIRALGIKYREIRLPNNQSGYFRRNGENFEIGVNANEGPQRRRFTAAHELGHYILHRDMLEDGEHFDRLFGDAAKSNPTFPFQPEHEIQANRFAADILMPSDRVLQAYRMHQSLTKVAEIYGVSKQAMRIRLESLQQFITND